MRLAYITTGYPYVSHTFIQKEVLALRDAGLEIATFALTRAPESECRTADDRSEWERTYALRPPAWGDWARAHGRAIIARPRLYVRALAQAIRMGLARPPRVLRHLAYFAQAVVLWHRCERDGISHVHAHFANVASDLALLASSLGGAGFSWSFTMHGPTEFFDVHQYRLREKTIDAAFVVCISDFARSQLMSLSPPSAWDSLYVVPCGVDVTHFVGQRPEHGESAAPPPAKPTDAVDILCVGRLVPEKGHTVLIRTVAALRSHGLEARLTLVGDGPERATLESLVEKLGQTSYVSFRGSISHAEIKRMLSECDIFCLPSFAEGVPIVLMEAMAMGLPVVACRVMGIPELIEDRVSGRLVRPGSADELASVLSELIESPALRSSLGQAACEQVTARFNLGVNVARLHALYREQLA